MNVASTYELCCVSRQWAAAEEVRSQSRSWYVSVSSVSIRRRYYERLDAYNCRSRMIVYSNIAEGNMQGYEASSIPVR